MHILLTTPGMQMWAVFGAAICRANNAIVYAHDRGWIFKTFSGNLQMTIPDPSLTPPRTLSPGRAHGLWPPRPILDPFPIPP